MDSGKRGMGRYGDSVEKGDKKMQGQCGKSGIRRCRESMERGMEDAGNVWKGEWKMQGMCGKKR